MRLVRRKVAPQEAGAARALRGERKAGFMLRSGRHCNLKCPHCGTDSGPHRQLRASPADAAKIMKNLERLARTGKLEHVGINGGEPMLNPEFVAEVVKGARRLSAAAGAGGPAVPVATNGTIFNGHVLRVLGPMKDDMLIIYSRDRFHAQRPAQIPEFERHGFATFGRQEDYKISAMGRAWGLKEADWKRHCESAEIRYVREGDSIKVQERRMNRHPFTVTEGGGLHLCISAGFVFGDLTQQDTFEIAEDLAWNEQALEFMANGPLGLAALEGKEKEAIGVFLEKGSCGVCHALVEGLI